MVRVPAAKFLMGCAAPDDASCSNDESPEHVVTLSSYFIDATEVSTAAYHECVASGACPAPLADDTPSQTAQAYVTWDDAVAFCMAVGKRLPTEAEWELAARGSNRNIWPWGNDAPTCDRANFEPSMGQHCYQDSTGGWIAPVDHGGAASPFGALDMAGNLEEWVADWYGPYSSASVADPTGPATGTMRVLRGGSVISSAAQIRTSARDANAPDATAVAIDPQANSITFGIRCARSQ
jgi:formylglycine-generating enzyme required for sulfatase activity